ncbi:MAG: MltA domain-containing protein [Saprospiraceae bacterium]|jgi:membrane-bound lytic murein transglycosylase A|nr:MltA domain-containing protein [Saprospiraceae bacterium]
MNKPYITLLLLGFVFSCQFQSQKQGHFPIQQDPSLRLFRNGKLKNAPILSEKFSPYSLDSVDFPFIHPRLAASLNEQMEVIDNSRLVYRSYGGQQYTKNDFKETIKILQSYQYGFPSNIEDDLVAYQIWGDDRRGAVKFTAYYTPIINVNEHANQDYLYPIYRRPKNWVGRLPSRAEIDGAGKLKDQALEIAYATNPVDIYYMQLQGSGYVQFPSGKMQLLAYDGSNRHPYKSIETFALNRPDFGISSISINGIKAFLDRYPQFQDTLLFHNPSYIFFKPKHDLPSGAAGAALQQQISIAVDKKHIPLGSCLLAAVPIFDDSLDRVLRHDFHILLAQDVGGAIKGPGHIDWYQGVGQKAQQKAEKIHHYGQLWILMPKRKEGCGVYIKK